MFDAIQKFLAEQKAKKDAQPNSYDIPIWNSDEPTSEALKHLFVSENEDYNSRPLAQKMKVDPDMDDMVMEAGTGISTGTRAARELGPIVGKQMNRLAEGVTSKSNGYQAALAKFRDLLKSGNLEEAKMAFKSHLPNGEAIHANPGINNYSTQSLKTTPGNAVSAGEFSSPLSKGGADRVARQAMGDAADSTVYNLKENIPTSEFSDMVDGLANKLHGDRPLKDLGLLKESAPTIQPNSGFSFPELEKLVKTK